MVNQNVKTEQNKLIQEKAKKSQVAAKKVDLDSPQSLHDITESEYNTQDEGGQ